MTWLPEGASFLLLFVIFFSSFLPYWVSGILGQHRTLNVAYFMFIILWFSTITVVSQQDIAVGGACEGCEAIFENKIPFEQLNHEITLSSLPASLQLLQ